MKRPKNLEVATVLKEKKLLKSVLWEVRPKDWSEIHCNEWKSILGISEKRKKDKHRPNLHNKIKVIRLSDNTIFDSIKDCMKKEGLYNVLMRELLKEGLKYKKVI